MLVNMFLFLDNGCHATWSGYGKWIERLRLPKFDESVNGDEEFESNNDCE